MKQYIGGITAVIDEYNTRLAQIPREDWTYDLNKTYICKPEKDNDVDNTYIATFRVPGATRGEIKLKKLSDNEYEILAIRFYADTSFGTAIGCYSEDVVNEAIMHIGDTLIFV